MISGNDLIGQNARKGLCDCRLVNAFCLVLGITLYNIKKERKLINQSNDKTDKITPSLQTVMSPNALTLRYKQRSQINKEKKRKNSFQLICASTCCVS